MTHIDNYICRFDNLDIAQAGRGRATHGGSAGRSMNGQNGMPTSRFG